MNNQREIKILNLPSSWISALIHGDDAWMNDAMFDAMNKHIDSLTGDYDYCIAMRVVAEDGDFADIEFHAFNEN